MCTRKLTRSYCYLGFGRVQAIFFSSLLPLYCTNLIILIWGMESIRISWYGKFSTIYDYSRNKVGKGINSVLNLSFINPVFLCFLRSKYTLDFKQVFELFKHTSLFIILILNLIGEWNFRNKIFLKRRTWAFSCSVHIQTSCIGYTLFLMGSWCVKHSLCNQGF